MTRLLTRTLLMLGLLGGALASAGEAPAASFPPPPLVESTPPPVVPAVPQRDVPPPPSLEQQNARAASLLLPSEEAMVQRNRMAKVKGFGIGAAIMGGLGLVAVIGAGVSYGQHTDVCTSNSQYFSCFGFVSNNQLLGGFLLTLGLSLVAAAVAFGIVALVNYLLVQQQPATAEAAAPAVAGSGRFADWRAAVAATSSTGVVVATF